MRYRKKKNYRDTEQQKQNRVMHFILTASLLLHFILGCHNIFFFSERPESLPPKMITFCLVHKPSEII